MGNIKVIFLHSKLFYMNTQSPPIVETQVDFYIDDVSDDVSVEGVSPISFFYPFVVSLVTKLREQSWFIEGNKTEGTLTFSHDKHINLVWRTIDMTPDLDDDVSDDYEQNIIVNPDTTIYKTIEL